MTTPKHESAPGSRRVDPGTRRDADNPDVTSTTGDPLADRGEDDRGHGIRAESGERRSTEAGAVGAAAGTSTAGRNLDTDRRAVVGREEAAFGGMKFGSDFFGWLTATGTAVLLTAFVAAAGAAVGLGNNVQPQDAAQDPQTVGLAGGIALLVVLLIAYFAGGYVAGRMARFNGLKQGLGVWLWAVIIAIVVAVVGLIAGAKFDILAKVNGFPRIPLNEGTLNTAGTITAVGLAVVSLIGALLGGLAGMHYHRKIDRVGFDPESGDR